MIFNVRGCVSYEHKLSTGQRVIDKNMYYSTLCDCLNYIVITYKVRDEMTRANWHDISLMSYNCCN